MSPLATARVARMRPIETADDSLLAASLFAEVAAVDDELADLAAGKTVDPFEIAEDGSAASFKFYEGTDWGVRNAANPILTLFVSRATRQIESSGSPYAAKGTFFMTPTVLVPTTAPAQPLTSSVLLVAPSISVTSGQIAPTSNAIVMTTTGLA